MILKSISLKKKKEAKMMLEEQNSKPKLDYD